MTVLKESILTEDKYQNIEVGTCIQLTARATVYEIKGFDNQNERVFYQSYKHPTGVYYSISYDDLDKYLMDGTIIILTKQEISDLDNY